MFNAIGFERATSTGVRTGRNALDDGHGRSHRGSAVAAPSFPVLHRRGARLAALRLPRSAGNGHAGYRSGGTRARDLRVSGGSWHWVDGEAKGLRAARCGIDTVEANHALGFKADCRDFSLSASILHNLGIRRVRLLSNNPRKAAALADAGIEVVQLACEAAPNPHALAYLRAKKEGMGHTLNLPPNDVATFLEKRAPDFAKIRKPATAA